MEPFLRSHSSPPLSPRETASLRAFAAARRPSSPPDCGGGAAGDDARPGPAGRPPLHPKPCLSPRVPPAGGGKGQTLPWVHRPPTRSERRVRDRLANAVARGALVGGALRGGLSLVAVAVAAVAPAKRAARARAGAPPALVSALTDTIRYASFLGAFAGTYVAVDEGLAAWLGKESTAAWRAAAAGAAAAPSVLILGPKTRHTSLALYLLLRGATLLVRVGNKPGAHPALRAALAPTRVAHGDTALMCAACAQITYSWMVAPHTLPRAFVRFLDKHGGRDASFYAAARELATRPASVTGPPAALLGTPLAALAGESSLPCDWAHPGASCDASALAFFPAALARAVPVYVPVYVLPALLVHGRALFDPVTGPPLWRKMAKGAARSATFLALYCTLCWRGACVGFRATGRVSAAGIPATAWVGGLATLVEKKSRRMELALYCASRALESFALCVPGWAGWERRDGGVGAPSPPGALTLPALRRRRHPLAPLLRPDIAILAAAAAAVGHCYSDARGAHRDVFRSKYLSVLDFVLGGADIDRGSIRHVPSASDLVAGALEAAAGGPAGGLAAGLATRARSLADLTAAALGSLSSRALSLRPSDDLSAASPEPLPRRDRAGEPPHVTPRFRRHGWEARLSGDPSDEDHTPRASPRGEGGGPALWPPAAPGGGSGAPLSPPPLPRPPAWPPTSPAAPLRPSWPPAARAAGAPPPPKPAGGPPSPRSVRLAARAASLGGDEALAP